MGLALATALSLAASMHSAQAAIVQITLNRVFTAPSTPIASSTIPVNDVTGQSTASTLSITLIMTLICPMVDFLSI